MMCNLKTCFWDMLIFTSNIIYNIKNTISGVVPNELSILVQNNFFIVRNKITYYIDTENKITSNTSLYFEQQRTIEQNYNKLFYTIYNTLLQQKEHKFRITR